MSLTTWTSKAKIYNWAQCRVTIRQQKEFALTRTTSSNLGSNYLEGSSVAPKWYGKIIIYLTLRWLQLAQSRGIKSAIIRTSSTARTPRKRLEDEISENEKSRSYKVTKK
jgi:hypothetical protein